MTKSGCPEIEKFGQTEASDAPKKIKEAWNRKAIG
jgi:hypothetical protein